MKPTVTSGLLTPSILEFIMGNNSNELSPTNVYKLLDFRNSGFWELYNEHWSHFITIRKVLTELMYDPNLVKLEDNDIEVTFRCKEITPGVQALLSTYIKQLGWGDYQLSITGYYFYRSTISHDGTATCYTLKLSLTENKYAVSN